MYIYIYYEIYWILLVKYSKVVSVVMFHACLIYIYSDIICSFFKSSE